MKTPSKPRAAEIGTVQQHRRELSGCTMLHPSTFTVAVVTGSNPWLLRTEAPKESTTCMKSSWHCRKQAPMPMSLGHLLTAAFQVIFLRPWRHGSPAQCTPKDGAEHPVTEEQERLGLARYVHIYIYTFIFTHIYMIKLYKYVCVCARVCVHFFKVTVKIFSALDVSRCAGSLSSRANAGRKVVTITHSIMVYKGNHPQMALIQVSEIL